ncbi:hypothetical protein FH972_024088 [Carpinus fangiana]|uniref:Uncharacterized protein n=1 Tax=Carpinus fangiana TaxID=176857 RepID=A0A5N6KXD4_9ROSI|nr:hypothetical protein FH972_024088 [Carpinus fangiana]
MPRTTRGNQNLLALVRACNNAHRDSHYILPRCQSRTARTWKSVFRPFNALLDGFIKRAKKKPPPYQWVKRAILIPLALLSAYDLSCGKCLFQNFCTKVVRLLCAPCINYRKGSKWHPLKRKVFRALKETAAALKTISRLRDHLSWRSMDDTYSLTPPLTPTENNPAPAS